MAVQDQNSGQPGQQAEDTTEVTDEVVEDSGGYADTTGAHWEIIRGFRTDTYGYVLEGHPYWSIVSDQELIDFGGIPASAMQGSITSVDLDLMPPESVGILKAKSSNVDETFETYYTMRPLLIAFPTIVWPTSENMEVDTAEGSADDNNWFSTNNITYSQAELDGLQAHLGDSNHGSGAATVEEVLKGRFQQFLLDLSTSTIQNQTIYTRISYNDMRVINASEIKGTLQSEENPQESKTQSISDQSLY